MINSAKQVPMFLQASFSCCVPLKIIAEDSSNETAWKLFLLIPRLLLQSLPRGSRSGKKQIKEKICNVYGGKLVGTLSMPTPTTASQTSNDNAPDNSLPTQVIRSVVSKIQCGEISRAANLLTSPSVASFSEATLEQLRAEHLPSKRNCLEIDPPTCPPPQITQKSFQETLCKCLNGSSAW